MQTITQSPKGNGFTITIRHLLVLPACYLRQVYFDLLLLRKIYSQPGKTGSDLPTHCSGLAPGSSRRPVPSLLQFQAKLNRVLTRIQLAQTPAASDVAE